MATLSVSGDNFPFNVFLREEYQGSFELELSPEQRRFFKFLGPIERKGTYLFPTSISGFAEYQVENPDPRELLEVLRENRYFPNVIREDPQPEKIVVKEEEEEDTGAYEYNWYGLGF